MADMADQPEDPPDGLERLTPTGRQLVPVTFRSLHTTPTAEATFLRLVESKPYRAKGYACSPFRKPISKCLAADADPDEDDV